MDFSLGTCTILTVMYMSTIFICLKVLKPESCPRLFSIEMRNYTILSFFFILFLHNYLPYVLGSKGIDPDEKVFPHLFPAFFAVYLIFLQNNAIDEEDFHRNFFPMSLRYWIPASIILLLIRPLTN
ncbi:unnamed protein product [Caenorhabditis auriculariae]|uniref:Uncharacterized protein n=1 Tax=Caenorhabditis auriculariae TaxID=2777116 RepID=A0A8S1HYD0_9PELO|nr:unnamed protein product [Caenorhabditis auriculariae]